ncbi:MAG: CAP domain-containing protein [Pseudomonadota bacterium]
MGIVQRWHSNMAGLIAASALVACGGGGGGTPAAPAPAPIAASPVEVGSPALLGNVATDGMNWINFRRAQLGVPVLSRNAQVDIAAQSHSEYQRANNTVAHEQISGRVGFTGVTLQDRLNAAGYTVPATGFAIGEIISAATSTSGHYLAEELVTAIYHRFVMFEPKFKEIGVGSAVSSAGYNYLTTNFAARGGYGPGLGRGKLVNWPIQGQTGVTPNFLSDYEAPDPVPGRNEVGYPISVHADIDVTLTVSSFTVRPRGGADLAVKLMQRATDPVTPTSAIAIIPLDVLRAGTTYDVTFIGTTTTTGQSDTAQLTRSWSFTTK